MLYDLLLVVMLAYMMSHVLLDDAAQFNITQSDSQSLSQSVRGTEECYKCEYDCNLPRLRFPCVWPAFRPVWLGVVPADVVSECGG